MSKEEDKVSWRDPDNEAWGHDPNSKPESRSSESAEEPNFKEGPKHSVGAMRKIGRIAIKLTAADVLAKDVQRIKPHFPNLWQDIISGRWRDVNRATAKQPVSRAATIAMVTGLITGCLILYTYALAAASSPQSPLSAWTVVSCAAISLAGLFQTFSYSYIAYLQKKRRQGTGVSLKNSQVPKGGKQ